ncbi:MAG: SDR family oxidoreductase [Chloroflexota bacterium]
MTTMQGKIAIVTGATNGIGQAIAEGLAQKGAEVIIVSRSAEKCATTTEQIKRTTGNPNVRYYAADLSSQADIRQLVTTLNTDLTRLDVLVNNAGAWFTEYKESVDGIEMTWALNHLNYFMLTHGLLDLLKRTAEQYGDARIINQSSMAHSEGKMHWDNLQFEGNYDSDGTGSVGAGWAVYSQSKLANVLHAFALADRLEGTGVVANAVHPGVVVTGFSQNNGLIYRIAAPFRKLLNRNTPADGAAPAVYLASAPEAATITATYYGPPQQREEVNPLANDKAIRDRLWEVSMAQIGIETA